MQIRRGLEDVKVNAFVDYTTPSGKFVGLKFGRGAPSKENKPWGENPESVKGIYPRVKLVQPVGERGTGTTYFRSRRKGDWEQLQRELEQKGFRTELVFFDDKTHSIMPIALNEAYKKHGIMGQVYFRVYQGHTRIRGEPLIKLMHSLRNWKPLPENPVSRDRKPKK